MTRSTGLGFALLLAVAATLWPIRAVAQTTPALASPLSLADVVRVAGERRDEIQAARARSRAGEARPVIVSALEDPMIAPSLDHVPFMMGGEDVSVTVEQRIPLSGIRRHRRASALADVDRLRAETNRITLDVGLQAANAFLMLQERRRTEALVSEQKPAELISGGGQTGAGDRPEPGPPRPPSGQDSFAGSCVASMDVRSFFGVCLDVTCQARFGRGF